MAKTQQQRIDDAVMALSRHLTTNSFRELQATSAGQNLDVAELMAKVLEAADRERPVWPTDESVRAYQSTPITGVFGDAAVKKCLRAAMLEDPIIVAAVSVCRGLPSTQIPIGSLKIVYDAVEAAGLLGGGS